MKINIGKAVGRPGMVGEPYLNPDITLDIDALVYSKALIQANSGGGKSGLIRVIVEKTIPHIPTIIIDPEGEFSTLREKFDIVLVGEQGELEADPRSAGLLARKLVELGASAVLDIYELKPDAKHQFVKAFLDSLMALPRKLWRSTFIVIDEAQMFAPERGMGESAALEAVEDLQFRGRKRGFGTILATPRLSMLHKNVAGANNIFIGRTNLDTDQKRCGKALGKTDKEAIELRTLKPREFYAYGPDLNVDGVTLFRVADCQTTIRKPGDRKSLTPPKASHVVEQIADKLKDIKQEAEKEIRDLNEAKTEIAGLNRKLKAAERNQSPREQDTKRIQELTEQLAAERAKEKPAGKAEVKEKKIIIAGDLTRIENEGDRVAVLLRESRQHAVVLEHLHDKISLTIAEAKALNARQLQVAAPSQALKVFEPGFSKPSAPVIRPREATGARSIASGNGSGDLSPLHRQILNGIALLHNIGEPEPTIAQVGAVIGKSHNAGRIRGGFNQVHEMGYAEIFGNKIRLTPTGSNEAVALDIRSRADIHNLWYQRLNGNELEFLRVLINEFPTSVSLPDLGAAIGKDINAGRIRGALNALFEKGLATLDGDAVTASSLLFPAGLA